MRRVIVSLVTTLFLVSLASAAILSKADREATIRYVLSLRNADGGFRPSAEAAPSSLGATSSALRALKYNGAPLAEKDRPATLAFVEKCRTASGSFSDAPGGTPDVRSTAMGLMSLAELGEVKKTAAVPARDYFAANARSLPDIYIAAAALDAAGVEAPKAAEWVQAFEGTRNPDGTYGKSIVDTAGAMITVQRVGFSVKNGRPAVQSLLTAQQSDGGWAAPGAETSDLSTTYRVMRGIWMAKARPDLGRLQPFIAKCRNADGGYGISPGKPSAAGPTYFAAIVLKWAEEMAR